MKYLFTFLLLSCSFNLITLQIYSQNINESLTNQQVFEKTSPSIVTILTSKGAGVLDKTASGVIIQSNGVILTAYHVVKGASQVQIRLKNGEIYDKVDLLSFDERRDVAALKITASNLSAVSINKDDFKIGGKIFVISNPRNLNWTIADGLLSSVRLADEIPNAGQGFRILQFSAPASPGSSGGLLIDEKGFALGLIVSTLSSGQDLNFAIPLSNVQGLSEVDQKIMSFGNGNSLQLPQSVRPPSSSEVINTEPENILKNAKIIYIYSHSELISDQMMENSLMKNSDFKNWKLLIVNDRDLADIIINVEHQLFTWDYRFTITDKRTSIVLLSGKTTAWDGKIASDKFTKEIMKKLKTVKESNTATASNK